MKRYAFIAGVICLSGTFVKAQESGAPAVEVGVNYSFVHVTSPQGLGSYGENGGSASFAHNVNRTLGLDRIVMGTAFTRLVQYQESAPWQQPNAEK